jgi:hypothetical protein
MALCTPEAGLLSTFLGARSAKWVHSAAVPRIHAVELEDLPWFPRTIRDAMTDYLGYVGNLTPAPYQGFTARLHLAMEAMGEREILDLCSGGTGPLPTIMRLLEEQHGYAVRARMTDLHPNLDRFEHARAASQGRIDFVATPVDATQVPADLGGFRLICNALHHFGPEQARALLANAVAHRRGIAVFEVLSRSLLAALGILPSPLAVLATTPFIRPFHWSRLLWTYAVPVVPLACLWDGMVSVMRIYAPDELQALVDEVPGSDDYVWDIGRLRVAHAPARITYLIGRPR